LLAVRRLGDLSPRTFAILGRQEIVEKWVLSLNMTRCSS